ncbi:MAG TPA: hemolysin family protein, partial [Chitinophagaceae bacterium]|nr:hemolysin family protein [Chitinophagaceae bacterium]
VQESAESGEIQEIEHGIVQRVFALGDRTVSELMTHRSDLVWLDINDSLDMVKEKMAAEIHSVYPVANGNLDELLGIISVRELFPQHLSNETFSLKDFVKKSVIVHDQMPVYNLLEQFKNNRQHNALIVDEYGTIQGMIAMDDIIDALIGDSTVYDHDDYQIVERDENSWLADGQYPFFEFSNFFALQETEGEQGNYNTLAGLILFHLHHIPTPGEKLQWGDFEFEIVDMDGRRIDKVLITRRLA